MQSAVKEGQDLLEASVLEDSHAEEERELATGKVPQEHANRLNGHAVQLVAQEEPKVGTAV